MNTSNTTYTVPMNNSLSPLETEDDSVDGAVSFSIPLSRDLPVGAVLFFVFFTFYAILGLRLADGRYLDYYNLAFDFDPYLFLSTMVLDPAEKGGFKHPLIIGVRPIAQTLLAFGLSTKGAAVLTMCLFGAGTNVLVWCFLRLQSVDRLLAGMLTVLFGISSTTAITAIVTESYGISNFAIVLTWLVTLMSMRAASQAQFARWRYVSALILVGATITNVAQSAIAAFCVAWQRSPWREAIRCTAGFAWKFAILFVLACFVVWYAEIFSALKDPVGTAKKLWWLQTKGETTGLLEIFQTFFGYSFVVPEISTVLISHDDAGMIVTRMWDFREWRFTNVGSLAMLLWLGGVAAGVFYAFKDKTNAKFYLGIAAALLFNIILHTKFQFRGSLFLYAAHSHFLIFALFAKTAVLGEGTGLRRNAYLAGVLALTVLVALNNFPVLESFANGFVQPSTNCQAPCK